MASYNDIKRSAAKSHNSAYAGGGRCGHTGRYASGGRVSKRPGVVINVIAGNPGAQGPAGTGPTQAPPGMNGPAGPMAPPPPPPGGSGAGGPPPAPINPILGNAALGKPAFAKGGRVSSPVSDLPTKGMGGAGSAYARLRAQHRGGK